MRVLVTGATGFLGRHIVVALLRRGHAVRAVHRSAAIPDFPHGVELARLDLRSTEGLSEALRDVDLVVHAAAVKAGDRDEQFEGTVATTQNLFAAMREAGVARIVLVSSFSVYVGVPKRDARFLDEDSPIGSVATARDTYAVTKLLQEQLLTEAATAAGWSATLARVGAVYGPGNLWTARLGYRRGQLAWLCVGSHAKLPVSYVVNTADALVHLAETLRPGIRTVNVVDSELPTQEEYRRGLIERLGRPRWLIVIPWPLVHLGSWILDRSNRLIGERLRLPGALRLETVRARWRPIDYPNAALRAQGWSPPVSWRDSLDDCTKISASATSSRSDR